jgi:hypothetical protein
MASTATTSILGNMLAGRKWNSSFNIGVGALNIPIRDGSFSLNPIDHINNIVTIRQHYKFFRSAQNGYGKISFDLQNFRFLLTASKYTGNHQGDFLAGVSTGGMTMVHDEKAIEEFYKPFESSEYRDVMGEGFVNEMKKQKEIAIQDFKLGSTLYHEGVHSFQTGMLGSYLWSRATLSFMKYYPNVKYEDRPWEKIAFKLEDIFKGK